MIDLVAGTLLLTAALAFWISTMSSRDAARNLVADFCKQNRLQLLDQTVALRKVTIARKSNGSLGLVRVFRFDYSENGFQRRDGMIWMLANRPTRISVHVDDQQVVEDLSAD